MLWALNYFPALRCLFDLFPHADVIGFELDFPALRYVYSICFLMQMYIGLELCFPALFVYLICFLMQILTLNYVSCTRCLVKLCFVFSLNRHMTSS
jgi:hypothetical protein